MGCVYSCPVDHPPPRDRSFHVINVDDRGNEINAGHIHITDTDLVLSQGESSILWPLRSLRRYGFDAELFSFECGRRCPTGPGIYAFRCDQAEQLFNNLQEAINKCTSYPLIASTAASHLQSCSETLTTTIGSAEDAGTGRQTQLSHQSFSSPSHSYVNAIHNYISSPIYNGPAGDQSISMPLTSHDLPTTGVTDINTNYAKLDDLVRYYVNINTPVIVAASQQPSVPTSTPTPPISEIAPDDDRKSPLQNGSLTGRRSQITPVAGTGSSTTGSNCSKSAIPGTRFQFPPAATQVSSPSKSPAQHTDPVNYIMLDLDTTTPVATPAPTQTHFVSTAPATPISKTPKSEMVWPSPPDTQMPGTPTSIGSGGGSIVNGQRMSYALIDFDKTDALTSAANQRKGLSIGTSS